MLKYLPELWNLYERVFNFENIPIDFRKSISENYRVCIYPSTPYGRSRVPTEGKHTEKKNLSTHRGKTNIHFTFHS